MASLSGSKRNVLVNIIAIKLQGLSQEDRDEILRLMASASRIHGVWVEYRLTAMCRALARAQERLNEAHGALRKLKDHE